MDFFTPPEIHSIWDITSWAIWLVVIIAGIIWKQQAAKANEAQLAAQQAIANTNLIKDMFNGFTGAIGALAEAVNKNTDQDILAYQLQQQNTTYLSQLNNHVIANIEVLQQFTKDQRSRDEKMNHTMAHLATTLGNVEQVLKAQSSAISSLDSTLTDNTQAITTMQESFQRMERNVVDKLDDIAKEIGKLITKTASGNDQHGDILVKLGEVKRAIIDLIPPEPKPPKIQPLPKLEPDSDEEKSDDKPTKPQEKIA